MSGGEIVGDVAQGALLASAVEPAHGATADGHTHESACLNCGTALVGPHCHSCGQAAHVHRSLGAFFHDLLHGVLHFEGKIWRTLPMLAWRPGQLTRGYVEGQRARYVSPIALFLFVVFVTFALFSALGGAEVLNPKGDALEQVKSAYATNEQQLADLRADRERAAGGSASQARLDARIDALEQDQNGLKMVLGNVGSNFERDFKAGFEKSPLPQGNALTEAVDKVRSNPQLAVYKLQTNAYKFSWLLIPISVPLLWLLFPFSRRFHLYDHTVFVTYSISFMLILIALASLGGFWNVSVLVLAPMLYAPFHMYRQLKGAYGLSRAGALWRTAALLWFATIALVLFAATLVTLVMSD